MNQQKYMDSYSYLNSINHNSVNEKLLIEKYNGLIRDNYLKVESKSPDFSLPTSSDDSELISNLIDDNPVAVSFHMNNEIQEIHRLNRILASSGIKHIAIVSNSRVQMELGTLNNVYFDDSLEIFNQFGLIAKNTHGEIFATNLTAIYLLNKDRSILYSKLNVSNEPINFISIIDTYTAIMQNTNKEKLS